MMNSQDISNCLNNWSTPIPDSWLDDIREPVEAPVWTPHLGGSIQAMVIMPNPGKDGIRYVLQNVSKNLVRCSFNGDAVTVAYGDDFIVDEAVLPGLSAFDIKKHLADDVSILVTGGDGTVDNPWLFSVHFDSIGDDASPEDSEDDSDEYVGGRYEPMPAIVTEDNSSAYPRAAE